MIEKIIFCNMLVDSKEQSELISSLLSKFSCIKIADCSYNLPTALESVYRKKPKIMFVDLQYADFITLVHTPTIFIGICNKKQLKNLKKYLDMGFKRFIEKPILEKDFLNVMGTVLNEYSLRLFTYAEDNYKMQAAEQNMYYNNTSMNSGFPSRDYIFLNGSRKTESLRIQLADIQYLQLIDNVVNIHFSDGSTKIMKTSLKYFLDRLPSDQFQKINRNSIININHIDKMMNNRIILQGETTLHTSRIFKQKIKQLFK